MRSNWPLVPLGEISDLFDGPHQTAPQTPGGPIVYLNVGDIRNGRIELALSGRVSEETARVWSRRVIPQPGDIVFGYEATVGQAAVLPGSHRWCLGRRVGLLRPRRERVDPRFLAYSWYSPSFQETLRANRIGGSTIESIRLTEVPHWSIPLPSLEEQRKIVEILGALDDRIELNQRMNEGLEAMARALFDSWFVKFDPVRAVVEGRPTSLPQPVADLFPKHFQDSELGRIPAGWRVGRLGEIVEHVRDPENPLLSPTVEFLHYSIPAFDAGRSPKRELGQAILSLKWRVPAGTILLSKLNPEIERVWMADISPDERAICSTEFVVLRALAPFTKGYIYSFARSRLFRQQIESLVTGTSKSHQRAHVGAIFNLKVLLPPSAVVEAFEQSAGTLLARTLVSRRESRALDAIRDALLPRLISGELRVPQAERMLETASG